MSSPLSDLLRQRMLITKMIWFGLTMNVFMLGFVVSQNKAAQLFDLRKSQELLFLPERTHWLAVVAILCVLV